MVNRYMILLGTFHWGGVSLRESQIDEMHAAKVSNTKEQPIVTRSFKKDPPPPPILGGLSEFKESTKSITLIKTPEL